MPLLKSRLLGVVGKAFLLAGGLLLVGSTSSPLVAQIADLPASSEDKTARIEQLIQQLGDPRYAVRSSAERQLKLLGLGAFDALQASVDADDPEIEATSRRLLTQAVEPMHRHGDSSVVQRTMPIYQRMPLDDRLEVQRRFGRINNEGGVPILCRLVRYEISPLLAKSAAMVLLCDLYNPEVPPTEEHYQAIRLSMIELDETNGVSTRTGADWLTMALQPESDPSYWLAAADAEIAMAGSQRHAETNAMLQENLLWVALHAALNANDSKAVLAVVDRLADLHPQGTAVMLFRVVNQLAELEQLETVQELANALEGRLQGRAGKYLSAQIAFVAGDQEQANLLAAEARLMPEAAGTFDWLASRNEYYKDQVEHLGDRILLASELDDLDYREWACLELELAAADLDPLSVNTAYACWELAELHFDSGEYEQASESLAGIVDLITSSREQERHYAQLSQQSELINLPKKGSLIGQRWLSQHFVHLQNSETDKAKTALGKAYAADDENADILIAMHKIKDADSAYRKKVQERVLTACRRLEVEIAADPTEPISYNHWAWLVANTEGDYAKAVRYSKRSLELSPENPGYLDTLGRCYFAAGDVDQAIATQRKAVADLPNMRVMRRQLKRFLEARNEQNVIDDK